MSEDDSQQHMRHAIKCTLAAGGALAFAAASSTQLSYAEGPAAAYKRPRGGALARRSTLGSMAHLKRRLAAVEERHAEAQGELGRLSGRLAALESDMGLGASAKAAGGAEAGTEPPNCTVIRFDDKGSLSACAAQIVAETLSDQRINPRVLLPTGTTPLGADGLFAALRRLRDESGLPTHRLRVVGGDEYAGVGKDEAGSFAEYTRRHVLEPLGCDSAAALLMDGGADDLDAQCALFEDALAQDPCEVAVLGLGMNGHLAFNDPPSAGDSCTRVLRLTDESIAAAQADFPNRARELLPSEALSIGIGTIRERCAHVVVLVSGAKKAPVLRAMLEGAYVGPDFPASQARGWRHLTILADADAAAELSPSLLGSVVVDAKDVLETGGVGVTEVLRKRRSE